MAEYVVGKIEFNPNNNPIEYKNAEIVTIEILQKKLDSSCQTNKVLVKRLKVASDALNRAVQAFKASIEHDKDMPVWALGNWLKFLNKALMQLKGSSMSHDDFTAKLVTENAALKQALDAALLVAREGKALVDSAMAEWKEMKADLERANETVTEVLMAEDKRMCEWQRPVNKRIAELEKQLDTAVEALKFYADKDNYKNRSEPFWDKSTAPPALRYPLGYPSNDISNDNGKKAEAALASIKEK